MTVALKVWVCNLLPEFLAYAFVFLCPLQPARAVPACLLQALPYGAYHFFILVQPYSHNVISSLGGVSKC